MTLSDAWVDFVAGWCSGAVAVVVIQPVDTILTRLQAAPLTAQMSASNATLSLAQTQGFRSLWRGATPMMSAVPVQNSLLMGGYGVGQAYSEMYAPDHKFAAIFTGGLVGGILQSFVMSPVELVKVNQQVSGASLKDAGSQVARNVVNHAAWRGLGATLLRDGIPHGVWFASYEACKDQLQDQGHTGAFVPLCSGAIAASVAWGVGYPADLIKTRIQASNSSDGIMSTALKITQEQGFSGLYRGFGLKLVRSIPASMIGFSVYEFVKEAVQDNF